MVPYMVGKLAPNSSHLTRGLVKHVLGGGCFRAVSSQNGDKFVTIPPPPIVERIYRVFPLSENLPNQVQKAIEAIEACQMDNLL